MALMPKIRFEGEYDESLKAVNNSNLRKQRVIPDGKLVYADSSSLPIKLPTDTMLFTTDTRELYIGTGDSIKRVNLGNDGEIIDKSDYLTKIEAARIYIQKDNIPDELVTEDELAAALKKINDTIDELSRLGDDITNIENEYLKKEDAKKFVDKDKLDIDLSKKVDIENLTTTGNHTFVRNNDNGVSLEYQNIAGNKNSSIDVGKDKIVINSSNTNSDKKGSKLYINQDGIYYTNSNDNNFENSDEILTKKDLSGLEKKINDNTLEIENVKSNVNTLSNNVTEAVKTAENAAAQVETAVTKAQTAIDTASGFADDINNIKNKVNNIESDVNTAKEKAASAEETAKNTANSLKTVTDSITNINASIGNLNTLTQDHESRIDALEKNSQNADIEELNKAIDDVKDIAEKNKTDIENLDKRVTQNESDIADLKSKEITDIDDIREKVNSISSIENQITTLISNISTTETATNKKIDDLTAAINQLRKDLTALNEKVDNYHKEEPIIKKSISSINKPDIFKNGIIDIAIGTPVSLPSSIEVTLDDGTKKNIDVSYDKTFNSTDVGTIQTITGTLVLPTDGSIENPENFNLEVSFRVYDYITNIVNNSISRSVEYNTQFNDIPDIPMTTTCNLASGNTKPFDIDWNEAKTNYDPENSSKQNLTGYIVEKDNIRNINNLNVALAVTVAARKFDIISINADETVHEVEFGTVYSALGLPSSVTVTLDDNSTKTVLVNWDNSTYSNTSTLTEQTISGTLVLDSNTTNSKGLIATYIVKVKEKPVVPKNIIEIESLSSKTVDYGTTFENLELPTSVSVTAKNDKETSTISLAVNWNSADYDLTKENVNQTITGELVLIDGVTNTNNLKASCIIKVKEQILNIISVNNDGIIHEVEYDTPYSSLRLPDKVTVTLSNNSTKDLAVTWSNVYSSKMTDTTQTLIGILTLASNITNNNDLKAEYIVKVKEKPSKNITSIQKFSTKEVEYDTEFSSLGLPILVIAEFDNGTTSNLRVIWNSADYSSTKTDAEQTITGELVLDEGMTNTNNLTATYKVKVKEQLNVVWVETFSKEDVEAGTNISDLGLPSKVKVRYNDDSEEQVLVTWNNSDYDPDQSGEQTIKGTLTIPEGKYNKNNMTSEFKVTVKLSSQGNEWEWTEYVKLESFANNIRKFPSKIGHDFTDEDVMGVWDEDDDTLMLEEPTVEFRYLGCMKTLTEGDKQTVTLLTEEQVHDPSIMNQNLMAVYPEGIKTPLGTGYETEENIEAYKSEIINDFGFTSNRGLFLENGLLRFEVAAHENNVYLVRKKKK